MFGIGLPEMLVILAVALIVVGPDKLPELARSLAKGANELRSVMNQVKESLSEETKVISAVGEELHQTAGQMKDSLIDEPGGPRQPLSDEALAEKEADLELAKRPWEKDTAEAVAEGHAAAEDTSSPMEESTVGKNPAPPAAAA